MRLLIRIGLPVALLVVLGAGLLPPVFARGSLDTDALNAARAASTAASSGSAADAYGAAATSVASDPGVQLINVKVSSGGLGTTVQVTVTETVHSFMDKFPGLNGWFHLTSTQQSQLGQ